MLRLRSLAITCLLGTVLWSGNPVLADVSGDTRQNRPGSGSEEGTRFSGNISWYGVPFHGRKTASGRIYDMNKLTCAHRTLPFGTKILIENPRTGKSVIVEVIDRGPYSSGRVIDVSREAARQLGTLLGGVAFVNCLVIYTPGSTSSSDSPGV